MKLKVLALAVVALIVTGCSTAGSQPSPSATMESPPLPTVTVAVETCDDFMSDGPVATGEGALPDITVDCLQGDQKVRLGAVRGPMIIAVWASWCVPCSEEMPIIQQFHDQYGDKVSVLGYALLDETSQAIAGSFNWGVTLPSLEDPDGVFRPDLSIQAPPTTLFIDENGRIVHREFGAVKDLGELLGLVDQHLGIPL